MRGLVLGLAAALYSSRLCADVLIVDLKGGRDFTEIQVGIDAAKDGDTVLVEPGDYVITEPIDFKGKLITVESRGGSETTTIRMSAPTDPKRASAVIFLSGEGAGSVLRGLTITGGTGTVTTLERYSAGGAIYCVNSSPTITDCRIRGNSAYWGGGATSIDPLRSCRAAWWKRTRRLRAADCICIWKPRPRSPACASRRTRPARGVACISVARATCDPASCAGTRRRMAEAPSWRAPPQP